MESVYFHAILLRLLIPEPFFMCPDPNLFFLKKRVLLKASIHSITPSDCRKLAIIISKEVGKSISETTIKRLYGFAKAKHQFSIFTLTALSEYIGKNSWEDFCEDVKNNPQQFTLGNWDELFYKAKSLSNFTLKTIKNRSQIPYEYTVNREFAERKFDNFYQNDYRFTSFVSQPGCGKSILISHLVEKFFLGENPLHPNDMLWFIDANNLYGLEHFDIDNWLNEQIGRGRNFINYFNEEPERRNGKVIIILDGFDKISLQKDLSKRVLNRIINFLCTTEEYDWLKIVLSLRYTTWIGLYEQIRHSSYLKTKFFKGSQMLVDDSESIPLLSDKEINQVLGKFSNINISQINPKLRELIKYPFYLQIYYQINESRKNLDFSSDLAFYEIISGFVDEKINQSPNYTEKILLLNKIIALSRDTKKANFIYKENFLNDITVFREAYEELLKEGILVEEKLSDHIIPKEIVRFNHPHIYEYFLLVQIIDNNHRNINSNLFGYIKTEFSDSTLRLQLFQWAVRHAVINHNISPVIELLKIKLPEMEKSSLMLFIVQILEFQSTNKGESFNRIVDRNLHKAFLTELIQLDVLDPCYKDIIAALRRLSKDPDDQVLYTCLLAYIALLELDMDQLESEICYMRGSESAFENWHFKPLDALSYIFNRVKNTGESNQDIYKAIDEFLNTPSSTKTGITIELTLSYILIFIINFLSGNFEYSTKVSKKIKSCNPNIFLQKNSLSIYLLNICAMNAFRIDSDFNPHDLIDLLEKLQKKKSENISGYLEAMFLMVKIGHCFVDENYEKAMSLAKECLDISENRNMSFLKVMLYLISSNIYEKLKELESTRTIRYKLHNLLEEKNIDISNFMHYNKDVRFFT